jgi:hypothetical protein
MTITERVRDIFNRYNINLEVTEQNRVEMAEATLENGTVIYTDGDVFDEGAEVYIINDEGERIPLPPGDYELADGVVLTIAEAGVVGKVDTSKAKGGDKGGVDPKRGGRPSGTERSRDAGGEGSTPTADSPTPTKDPVKSPTRTRQSADEKEELIDSPLTREMVEEMIREAIAALLAEEEELGGDKKRRYEDEEKEEMSAVDTNTPETEEVATETPENASEETEQTQLSAALKEVDELKTQLEEVKKQAATSGLKHAAPRKPAEPVDMTSLTTAERVRVLANQFSK